MGEYSPRFVVVLVTWPSHLQRDPPGGMDLPMLVDMRRGRVGCPSIRAQDEFGDNLRLQLGQLHESVSHIGFNGQHADVNDVKRQMQAQLGDILSQVADVWALRDVLRQQTHTSPNYGSQLHDVDANTKPPRAGRLTVLEEQVKA